VTRANYSGVTPANLFPDDNLMPKYLASVVYLVLMLIRKA
jgi:hypothetical protein